MDIAAAWVTYMMGRSEIANLLGARLYPVLIPQDAQLPAAAYQLVDQTAQHRHGMAPGAPALRFSRLQVTVNAATYETARQIAAAIMALCDGYRGAWGLVRVERCFVSELGDGWAANLSTYTTRLDLEILHT